MQFRKCNNELINFHPISISLACLLCTRYMVRLSEDTYTYVEALDSASDQYKTVLHYIVHLRLESMKALPIYEPSTRIVMKALICLMTLRLELAWPVRRLLRNPAAVLNYGKRFLFGIKKTVSSLLALMCYNFKLNCFIGSLLT